MRTNLTPDELTGWAIRMAREYRGLSIGKLAEQLGYHRNTLSAVEKGERPAKHVELAGIAHVLKWPIEWLMQPQVPGDDTGVTTGDGNAPYRMPIFASAAPAVA